MELTNLQLFLIIMLSFMLGRIATIFIHNRKESFAPIIDKVVTDKKDKENKVNKGEKITMYGRETCGYTVKMKEQLTKDGVMDSIIFVDTATKEGQEKLEKVGGSGVPHFTFEDKKATGYMKTKELLDTLGLQEQ